MNAFEIRLEVLKMARDMMDRQYKENCNFYFNAVETAVRHYNVSYKMATEMVEVVKPTMYTTEEIAEKAKELYSFVSTKD